MAKNTIHILCPSGHRLKAEITPNGKLLQVLENVCRDEDLDSSEWGLLHQRTKCDLTAPWRLLGIPTNAVLELHRLDDRRQTADVHVQLQLPDNSRYRGWFEPTVTLQEMLDWYRFQPESMIAALDISMSDGHNLCPVCSYMNEEVIGDYALANTTLYELGLHGGAAVVRYDLRPVTDGELQRVQRRIMDKVVRQTSKQDQPKAKQQEPQRTATTRPSNTKPPTAEPNIQSSHDEQYSIFRDPPVSRRLDTTAKPHQQARTLAEELGLDLSLDPESVQERRAESRTPLRDFKFPDSTREKDLRPTEPDDDARRAHAVKVCDRHALAYDVTRTRSTHEAKPSRSEDPSANFYDLTPDDLRSVLHGLHQLSSNENPLETQAMREKGHAARDMTYERIAIRFVVNSRHVLQALFRPEEPVSRLIDFARASVKCVHMKDADFYLYTSLPRVILADLDKPLSAYDLAPAAYVYLGHRTVSPLNAELVAAIPVRSIDEANQISAHYVFSRAAPTTSREHSTLHNDRPASATSLTSRPAARAPPANSLADQQLRDKLRKFIPGRK